MIDNPWVGLPAIPPFVLPEDLKSVARFNESAKDETRIHVDLLPEPFIGRLDAPIVLLSLNPGYSEGDSECHRDPLFRRLSLDNLRQRPMEHPFFLISPDIQAPGRRWWEKKLAGLLRLAPRDVVARRLLCVEYFGYHSRRFAHAGLSLPSQDFAFQLVRDAVRRRAIIVLMRSRKLWFSKVTELAEYTRLIELGNVQNPTVSPGNCRGRFDEIASALLDDDRAAGGS